MRMRIKGVPSISTSPVGNEQIRTPALSSGSDSKSSNENSRGNTSASCEQSSRVSVGRDPVSSVGGKTPASKSILKSAGGVSPALELAAVLRHRRRVTEGKVVDPEPTTFVQSSKSASPNSVMPWIYSLDDADKQIFLDMAKDRIVDQSTHSNDERSEDRKFTDPENEPLDYLALDIVNTIPEPLAKQFLATLHSQSIKMSEMQNRCENLEEEAGHLRDTLARQLAQPSREHSEPEAVCRPTENFPSDPAPSSFNTPPRTEAGVMMASICTPTVTPAQSVRRSSSIFQAPTVYEDSSSSDEDERPARRSDVQERRTTVRFRQRGERRIPRSSRISDTSLSRASSEVASPKPRRIGWQDVGSEWKLQTRGRPERKRTVAWDDSVLDTDWDKWLHQAISQRQDEKPTTRKIRQTSMPPLQRRRARRIRHRLSSDEGSS